MSHQKPIYQLPYNSYLKLQKASTSLGEQLPVDKRQVNIHSVVTDKGTLLVAPTGSLHSNIFDSHISCFIFTPIDEWSSPTVEEFTGLAWDYKTYIGLVFTCRNKLFVISGSTKLKLDIASVDFETNIDKIKEFERKECATGMGWRARYFNGNLPKATSVGNAVYCYYGEGDYGKRLYNIHIRTPKGLVDYYLGDSPECVAKLDSILNQSADMAPKKVFDDIVVDIVPDIVHTFNKNFCKEDQLSLF